MENRYWMVVLFYKEFCLCWMEESKTVILVIDTNKKWADRAGVSELADATTENGWHGEPSCIWYVQAGDVEKRERVAGYLAQVCIARHR